MRTASLVTATAVFGLLATPALADSITTSSFPLAGTIGGPGGYHTVVIDGVSCRLKNSTRGPNQGCNYTLTGGVSGQGQGTINVQTNDQGCSRSCER
jgi:hypothetical protein